MMIVQFTNPATRTRQSVRVVSEAQAMRLAAWLKAARARYSVQTRTA